MRPKTYMLAKAIQERRDVLFGNADGAIKSQQNVKDKEEAWESVRMYMIENGFLNFEKKSWREVRNHDWQYLRRSAVAKLEHNQKFTSDLIQYSEVDKIVFDIMGNEGLLNDSDFDKAIGMDGMVENFVGASADSFIPEFSNGSLQTSPYSWGVDSKVNVAANGANDHTHGSDNSASSMPSNLLLPSDSCVAEQVQNKQQSHQQKNDDLKSLLKKTAQQQSSWDDSNNNTGMSNQNSNNKKDSSNFLKMNSGLLTAFSPTNMAVDYSRFLNGCGAVDFFTGLNSIFERNATILNDQVTNKRKRLNTSVGDDFQDARLQLLFVQIKREEALLQQEQAKVLQEYAKARQEHVKAELLECELAEKKKKD